MTVEQRAALDALGRARGSLLTKSAPATLQGLGAVLFEPPDAETFDGKTQITVPALVRRRWTSRGADEKLKVTCIEISRGVLLVLPTLRARAWTASRTTKLKWYVRSMQERGHFEVPAEIRNTWNTKSIVKLDLGYCLLLLPEENVTSVLNRIWGWG